jgi:carbon monoxide dehydrogenase subunit G
VKISGSYTIDAPRDVVWEALNDIEVLARCVPGCERLEQVGDNEYEGTIKIGIQAIRGVYSGRIRIEDIDPPNHYKLIASGKAPTAWSTGSAPLISWRRMGRRCSCMAARRKSAVRWQASGSA